jgi:hypothetical protein
MREYPETHQIGDISIENLPTEFGLQFGPNSKPYIVGDLGIQIAEDGRVWVCIDGLAFIRFKPTRIMEPLPDYGVHMTMELFIKHVNEGGFIDYDGYGHYATETEMLSVPSIDVRPSMVEDGTIDKSWTHIVWFNR